MLSIPPRARLRVPTLNRYPVAKKTTKSRSGIVPPTAIHDLYGRDDLLGTADNLPPAGGRDEPSLLWVAAVFKAGDMASVRENRPLAIYNSSSAFRILPGTSQEGIPSTTTAKGFGKEEPQPTWRGRIFEVFLRATAHFPSDGGDDVLDRGYYRPRRYCTENFESLVFEKATRSSIRIVSPFLYNRLKILAGYYPHFSRQFPRDLTNLKATSAKELSMKFIIPYPWAFLLHRFPEIEAFVQGSGVPDTHVASQGYRPADVLNLEREHMKFLYDFLKPHYEENVLPYLERLQQPSPSFPFNKLWCVFKPGTDVYVQLGDSIQAMVVLGIKNNLDDNSIPPEAQITQTELTYWSLDLWYLASDGENIGRQFISCRLYSFPGLKKLTELEACPVSIWDAHDEGARRKRLMQRGRLIFKSLQQGHLLTDYKGPVDGGARHYSGTMIIDIRRGMALTRSPRLNLRAPTDASGEFRDYDNIYVYEVKNAVGDSWALPYDEGYTGLRPGGATRHGDPIPPSFDFYPEPQPSSYAPRPARPAVRRTSHEPVRISHATTEGWYNKSGVYSHGPNLGENYTTFYPSEKTERSLRDTLTDHQFLLLCPKTLAFALKTKQWVTIMPDHAIEVEQSDESLANLVLDESELSTIKALASRQNSKRDIWAADFIEGKGTGQIILFHGPSGVGKTYTVEAIAQYLHRPLLALTIADIGTLEMRVEQELLKWFSLAEAWDAVLLVDEADIFLERRQNRDLARNGLVSAFLRRMEYFKGLLFLTTNRVGQIDDAFISRVHVAIGYPSLSPANRSEIWKGFFRKLNKERAGKIQISQGAKKWVLDRALTGSAQLNGRDIRNALQTAITLAEAEYEEDPEFDPETTVIVVDQSHFERVLDITNKFQTYVESIRREDEKKRAAGRHDRNDYYWTAEQSAGARP
ncbi:hypothetical protein O1611_g155 [Lasiodiplodia mahajangana]|uniref:Uncharacterized protein n=1 Tax=Lasiodiplodia mahajangana TaxID=1108764 RepID=A0ACC2K1E4_9PEZI|nr:hypothetical protein O1611_g155 [Lasiodiplodia mahajangana]